MALEPYSGITLILDDWGIHLSFRGGWKWNIWEGYCVVVNWKNGGKFQIDTEDAENLARFLAWKTQRKRA